MRKHPLKVNVFNFMRSSGTALAPMFPYQDPGSIVPCISTFRGAPGRSFGVFQHFNTVDEVMINFGSRGTAVRPGMVVAGPQLHQVSVRMSDPDDTEACQLSVITQRQAEPGTPQHEHVTFFCSKCQAPLVEHKFSSQSAPEVREKYAAGAYDALETLVESAQAAIQYNGDPDAQTCKKCGHVNEPFPLEPWGWDRYLEQSLTAATTYETFTAAAAAAKEDAG